MKRVLIAWSPGPMASRLQQKLRRHFSNGIEIQQAADQREAKELLQSGRYDLLIAQADLSFDDNSSTVTGDYLGVNLFAWMNQQQLDIPGVIITPVLEPKLADALGGLANVGFILEGVDSDQKLVEAAERYFRNKPAPQFLKVTIFADAGREWRWELEGEGFTYQDSGRFVIDATSIEQLEEESVTWDEDLSPNWPLHLKFLGWRLMERIFRSNLHLWMGMNTAWERLDARTEKAKMDMTKICFHAVRSVHPIFFEALVSDDALNEFWMLNAPIYRRFDNYRSSRQALFPCGVRPQNQKLNCLIIEADASGPVEGLFEDNRPLDLEKLDVQKDCENLEKFFVKGQDGYGIGRVLRVDKKLVGDRVYFDVLRNILEGETWHLVHYSGHSFYDRGPDKGYLFFPSATEGELPDKVEIGTLSAHLQDAQLVFLSGCRSSTARFIASLAKCEIPAAIGFRSKVEDQGAIRYAQAFYKQLFAQQQGHSRCLQHAFLQTRQLLHVETPQDKIWAKPLLLVQSK
jgi:hypothetical protein